MATGNPNNLGEMIPLADAADEDLGRVLPAVFAEAAAGMPPPRPRPAHRPVLPFRGRGVEGRSGRGASSQAAPTPSAAAPVADASRADRSRTLLHAGADDEEPSAVGLDLAGELSRIIDQHAALETQTAILESEFQAKETALIERLEVALLERMEAATAAAQHECHERVAVSSRELRAAEQQMAATDRQQLAGILAAESAAYAAADQRRREECDAIHAQAFRNLEAQRVELSAQAFVGFEGRTRLQLRQYEAQIANLDAQQEQTKLRADRAAGLEAQVTVLRSRLTESEQRVHALRDRAQQWANDLAATAEAQRGEQLEVQTALQQRLDILEQEDDIRRRKGAAKSLTLGPLPSAVGFRERVQDAYAKVNAASKRSKRRTMRWMQRIETVNDISELEALAEKEKRWGDPDSALAEAVLAIANSNLKRELLIYREERSRMGLPHSGRCALYMVYYRCTIERGQAMSVDLTTLVGLGFGGDLEGFLNAWDYALMALAKVPDEDMLCSLLEWQLRKCMGLEPAFVTYDAAEEGAATRASAFPYKAARREIVRRRRGQAWGDLMKLPQKAAPAKTAAAAAAAAAAAKAKAQATPQVRSGEICQMFARDGSRRFGANCMLEHVGAASAPDAAAAKARAKAKAGAAAKAKAKAKAQAKAKAAAAATSPAAAAAQPDDQPARRFWPRGERTNGESRAFKHVGPGKAKVPGAVCRAAPATGGPSDDLDEFALDSGAGNDLAPVGAQGVRRQRDDLCFLSTANGVIAPETTVSVGLEALNEHGYRFAWGPFADKPEFYAHEGSQVDVRVENFAPMVAGGRPSQPASARRQVRCMPAMASAEADHAAPAAAEVAGAANGAARAAAQAAAAADRVDDAVIDASIHSDPQSILHLATHLPKCPPGVCAGCDFGKTAKSRSSRRPAPAAELHAPDATVESSGALVHMDHVEVERSSEARKASPYSLRILDESTEFFSPCPARRRGTDTVLNSVGSFDSAPPKIRRWRADSAPEFRAAARVVRSKRPLAHYQTTPRRAEANGKIERMNRVAIEGARCSLHQSGLSERWWPLAERHWAANYSGSVKNEAGLTRWQRRFEEPAPFVIYPFGALVLFRPPAGSKLPRLEGDPCSSSKWKNRLMPALLVGVAAGPAEQRAKSYLIAPLAAILADGRASRVNVRTVADVVSPSKVTFPLAQRLAFNGALRDLSLPAPRANDDAEGGYEFIADEPCEEDVLAYDGMLKEGLDVVGQAGDGDAGADDPHSGHAAVEPDVAEAARLGVNADPVVQREIKPGPGRSPPSGWRRGGFGADGQIRRSAWAPPWPTRPPTLEPEARLSLTTKHRQEKRREDYQNLKAKGKVVAAAPSMPRLACSAFAGTPHEVCHEPPRHPWHRGSAAAGGQHARASSSDARVASGRAAGPAAPAAPAGLVIQAPTVPEIVAAAMPAIMGGRYNQMLVELCCSPESCLSAFAPARCIAIRVTEQLDLAAEKTLRAVQDILKRAARKKLRTMIWTAAPMAATRALITNVAKVCTYARDKGQDVTWEWPTNSDLWSNDRVHQLINTVGGKFVKVSASAVGQQHQHAGRVVYTQKEWTLCSTDDPVTMIFENYSVDEAADSKEFVRCRGKIAKQTAQYTADCDGARKALEKELHGMRSKQVWGTSDAMLARAFAILGIKGEALGKYAQQWKARVVFQGSNIRTKSGVSAADLFEEVANAPAPFAAARAALAAAALAGQGVSLIDTLFRIPTHVELPREWWPDSWFLDGAARQRPKYVRPHCRLKKALRGHPEAGALWEAKLNSILKQHGWEPAGLDHPGTWARYTMDPANPTCPSAARRLHTDMDDYVANAVARFASEYGGELRKVTSPFLSPEQWAEDGVCPGVFAGSCASHVATLLILSRVARPDIAVAVQRLCSVVSKWSTTHDAALARLYAYLKAAGPMALAAELAPEDIFDLELLMWSDADWAGDSEHAKSTGGVLVELHSPTSGRRWPLSLAVRKQTPTAGSTAEAETVALSHNTKHEGIPTQMLLERMLGIDIPLVALVDNAQAISAVSIGLLHELVVERGAMILKHAPTATHRGDGFTKAMSPARFMRARDLMGMIRTSP
ncbi:unnamed protein product [Prorocentrum cordatum]|uniref:Integrase catalytic domain-containing protein n=1 Tax=Prorocentrum cordatum TaxID=2364126 RepID=A0ABN9QTN7_9DINO|nr:unnamed protein product [Polarella glacialis]